ncbi:MAG TPA: TMEM175 family protein [Candidatus Saccharimonadales bacterium]|nr:TMEM175 family protein [Candidatus Saccharimonadales bacterium]
MSDLEIYSTRRLEALTDGVFAIAMTLLVLDVHVRDFGHIASSSGLWQAIQNIDGSIITFVISFLLLGSMWAVHMRQFEFIKRADRHLTMINTLRLLTVVFIPLTTSVAGNYSDVTLGRILFPINFFLLAAVSYWEWNYAVTSPRKLYDSLSEGDKRYLNFRNATIVVISLLVVLLAAAIGEYAFLLFMIAPSITRKRFTDYKGQVKVPPKKTGTDL